MIVGVLAVQGSFYEHKQVLEGLVDEVRLVRRPEELEGVSGLVIPGGESTTIGEFLSSNGLAQAIKDKPIFGTCAGLIVLASKLRGEKKGQFLLKMMDAEVERNAYGRQVESFEADLRLDWDKKPYRGVFIRAPKIVKYAPHVKVLAWLDKHPVMIRGGNRMACAFHPELGSDDRIHRYFIDEVISKN